MQNKMLIFSILQKYKGVFNFVEILNWTKDKRVRNKDQSLFIKFL